MAAIVRILAVLLLSHFSDNLRALSTFENDFRKTVENLEKMVERLQTNAEKLSRQVMMQQFYVEEKIRSDGSSGLKQIRQAYYSQTHTGDSFAAIHDHANNIRTVGMGEFLAVLNGVEFRSRHNNYKLRMPSKTSSDYHSMEDIPFPDVPPEVLNKPTVDEQITEMREWFKAWRNQDYSVRDYRPYFRPVFCYLEGAWTITDTRINEPFDGDRHSVDASMWFDLQEKIRYTSYSNRKDNLENFTFLPTTIMRVENETAIYAHWNYRIACHPIKNDLPTNVFRLVDDLETRISKKWTIARYQESPAARYRIDAEMPKDGDTNYHDKTFKLSLLDDLMYEIPGKNNYLGHLVGDEFRADDEMNIVQLNKAYYHRVFKRRQKDEMGSNIVFRGFTDRHVFFAQTTQPQIASNWHNRWSYAIPLEVIYMTPLYNWNPHNLTYKGEFNSPEGKTVTDGGRNGGMTSDSAYSGTNSDEFRQTPVGFFSGVTATEEEMSLSSGGEETSNSSCGRGVLDPDMKVRRVCPSGTHILLPNIHDLGRLRTRYPIAPLSP